MLSMEDGEKKDDGFMCDDEPPFATFVTLVIFSYFQYKYLFIQRISITP